MMKTFTRFLKLAIPFFLTSTLVFFTCNEEPSKPPVDPSPTAKPTIKLEVQFEDFTEVLLKVTVSDTGKWKYVTVHRDGKLVHFESFLSKDTVITDDGLESKTNYSYQASLIENGRAIDSSAASAKTREYGSQRWRFEIDTLGENLSGVTEVIAFSKTEAWATGFFYIYSAPNKRATYSLARWNGQSWSLIQFFDKDSIPQEGSTIFGLNNTDIWFDSYHLYHFNGISWNEVVNFDNNVDGVADQIFGTSSNEIYFIGYGGNINLWNGSKIKRLSSPTKIDLEDIYGDEGTIYIAGTSHSFASSVEMKLENGVITKLRETTSAAFQTSSIWLKKKDSVIAYAGNGNKIIHLGDTIKLSYVHPYCLKVRGTGIHNIWFVGHLLELQHYDGRSWKTFPEITFNFRDGMFKSLEVGEDYLFAAGWVILNDGSWRGIVVRGYRL